MSESQTNLAPGNVRLRELADRLNPEIGGHPTPATVVAVIRALRSVPGSIADALSAPAPTRNQEATEQVHQAALSFFALSDQFNFAHDRSVGFDRVLRTAGTTDDQAIALASETVINIRPSLDAGRGQEGLKLQVEAGEALADILRHSADALRGLEPADLAPNATATNDSAARFVRVLAPAHENAVRGTKLIQDAIQSLSTRRDDISRSL